MKFKVLKTYVFFCFILTVILSMGSWVSASDHDIFSGITGTNFYQLAANSDFDLNQPDTRESLSLIFSSEEIDHHKITIIVVMYLVCKLLSFSPVVLENPFNIVMKVIKPPSRFLA